VRSSSSGADLNVVCLKWGTLYDARYVNNLYRMVSRHLSRPFRFICFTDDSAGLLSDVEVYALPEFEEPDWQYARYCSAWRKLALFDSTLANMRGKVLFLDLDVVIVDSIDCIASFAAPFAMIENWYQPGRQAGQASVMCFDVGYPESLLHRYRDNPVAVLERYRTEQAYIASELGERRCTFFPDAWCKSFKKHCLPTGIRRFWQSPKAIPGGARIMVFHGRPNPPDAIEGVWGKKLPWYKRWYKRIKPCPWVAQHWC